MKPLRRFVAPLLILAVFVASSQIAYALGIQFHTANGVYHGCTPTTNPSPGCNDGTRGGDFFYEAFTQGNNSGRLVTLNGPWVSIHRSANSRQVRYGYCSRCTHVGANYDTNPYYECEYKSFHIVPADTGSKLAGHYHYTEAARSTTGCSG